MVSTYLTGALRILRIKQTLACTGDSRSGTYQKIAGGLLPKPVPIGGRSVGLPEHEIQAVLRARVAGWSDAQIRDLVTELESQRAQFADALLELVTNSTEGHRS